MNNNGVASSLLVMILCIEVAEEKVHPKKDFSDLTVLHLCKNRKELGFHIEILSRTL